MDDGHSRNRVHRVHVTSKSSDGKATTVLQVHNLRCADLRKEFERVLVDAQSNAKHTVETEQCGPALLFLALKSFASDRAIAMAAAQRATLLNPRSRLGALIARHGGIERMPKSYYPAVATKHILRRINFAQIFSAVLRHTGLDKAADDADRLKRPRLIVYGCRDMAELNAAQVIGKVKSLTLLDLSDSVLQEAAAAVLDVTGGRLPASLRLVQSTLENAELPKSWGRDKDTFVMLPMVLGRMSEQQRIRTLRNISKRGFHAIILDFSRFGNCAVDNQIDSVSRTIDAFEQGLRASGTVPAQHANPSSSKHTDSEQQIVDWLLQSLNIGADKEKNSTGAQITGKEYEGRAWQKLLSASGLPHVQTLPGMLTGAPDHPQSPKRYVRHFDHGIYKQKEDSSAIAWGEVVLMIASPSV